MDVLWTQVLKAVEPTPSHVLFLLWRIAENYAFGFVAIQHVVNKQGAQSLLSPLQCCSSCVSLTKAVCVRVCVLSALYNTVAPALTSMLCVAGGNNVSSSVTGTAASPTPMLCTGEGNATGTREPLHGLLAVPAGSLYLFLHYVNLLVSATRCALRVAPAHMRHFAQHQQSADLVRERPWP